MTESEAKKTWCPAVRITMLGSSKNDDGGSDVLIMNNRGECNFKSENGKITLQELNCCCIGALCQKWVWAFIADEVTEEKPCKTEGGFCERIETEDVERIDECEHFLSCLSIYQRQKSSNGSKEVKKINEFQGFCTMGFIG